MREPLIKRLLLALDRRFITSLYGTAAEAVNFVSCRVGYAMERLKCLLGVRTGALKLHLGCGDQHLEGYVNIDRRRTRATDVVCGITRLPYRDNSVQLIETYHVIEHLPRHDLPKALREWYRVMVAGRKLVIECPDFDAAVQEYIAGKEQRLDSIFGLQRFPGDAHLFGYNFARLKAALEAVGFVEVEQKAPQDYHVDREPCLRVECRKGAG